MVQASWAFRERFWRPYFLEKIYAIVNGDFLGAVAIVADDNFVDRRGRVFLYMSSRPL